MLATLPLKWAKAFLYHSLCCTTPMHVYEPSFNTDKISYNYYNSGYTSLYYICNNVSGCILAIFDGNSTGIRKYKMVVYNVLPVTLFSS